MLHTEYMRPQDMQLLEHAPKRDKSEEAMQHVACADDLSDGKLPLSPRLYACQRPLTCLHPPLLLVS